MERLNSYFGENVVLICRGRTQVHFSATFFPRTFFAQKIAYGKFFDYCLAMTEMSKQKMIAALTDIQVRRYAPVEVIPSVPGYSPTSLDHLKAHAEATTQEDVDTLNQAYNMLDDFAKQVLRVREEVWSEFTRGIRCGVCGRTAKQSAAIGYDCAREC